MFQGSAKSTGYLPHLPVSPSLPILCVTVCHHISTGVYQHFERWRQYAPKIWYPCTRLQSIVIWKTSVNRHHYENCVIKYCKSYVLPAIDKLYEILDYDSGIKILIFWNVTPYTTVDTDVSTVLYNVTFQKTIIWIWITVPLANLQFNSKCRNMPPFRHFTINVIHKTCGIQETVPKLLPWSALNWNSEGICSILHIPFSSCQLEFSNYHDWGFSVFFPQL